MLNGLLKRDISSVKVPIWHFLGCQHLLRHQAPWSAIRAKILEHAPIGEHVPRAAANEDDDVLHDALYVTHETREFLTDFSLFVHTIFVHHLHVIRWLLFDMKRASNRKVSQLLASNTTYRSSVCLCNLSRRAIMRMSAL